MIVDQWFAIRVKSNQEHVCALALDGRGYEVFLPRHRRPAVIKKTEVDRPLFPGYLFCRFDCKRRLPVLTVPGIVHIVGIGRTPHPIEDDEIEALQLLVKTDLYLDVSRPYTVGAKVKVTSGPLAGVSGIVSGVRAGSDTEPTLM